MKLILNWVLSILVGTLTIIYLFESKYIIAAGLGLCAYVCAPCIKKSMPSTEHQRFYLKEHYIDETIDRGSYLKIVISLSALLMLFFLPNF